MKVPPPEAEEEVEEKEKEGDEEEETSLDIQPRGVDKIYGPHWEENQWKLGNVRIRFFKDKIIVGDVTFPRTPGLYNLIVHKKPKVYDLAELTPYKKILEISNVHKKYNGELKTHPSSSKFKEIISVLFELKAATRTPTPRTPTSFQDSAYKYFSPRLNKKSTPNSSFKKSFGKGLIPRYKIAR